MHRILTAAEADVATLSAALSAYPNLLRWRRLPYSSEQAPLLVRVAADSGARRGARRARHCDVDESGTGDRMHPTAHRGPRHLKWVGRVKLWQ